MKPKPLVTQSNGFEVVTVAQGGTPVINHEAELTQRSVVKTVAMALNFIRSGCPGAQLIFTNATSPQGATDFKIAVEEALTTLTLPEDGKIEAVLSDRSNRSVALVTLRI